MVVSLLQSLWCVNKPILKTVNRVLEKYYA